MSSLSSVLFKGNKTVKCEEAADYDGRLVGGQSLRLAVRRGQARLHLEVGVERILESNTINTHTDYLHPDNHSIIISRES